MDEWSGIADLSDAELIELALGAAPDAAEVALSELYFREHPQTAEIARRLAADTKDEWLRGSALAILLQLRTPEAWTLVEAALAAPSPPVLVRIVEELATTDAADVSSQRKIIDRARARLGELPEKERYLADLFHERFRST